MTSRRRIAVACLLLLLPSSARAERVFTTGFEFATITDEWTSTNGAAFTVTADAARFGRHGMRMTGFSSGTRSSAFFRAKASATDDAMWLQFYLRLTTAPDATNRAGHITGTAAGGTSSVWFAINADRTLAFGDEDGTIGSSATALTLGTWYRVVLHINTTGLDGAHVATLYIGGVSEVSASNRTIDSTVGGFQIGGNLAGEANTSGSWDFDDVALFDDAGAAENSLPTVEEAVVHLTVNANGDMTNAGTQGTDWDTGTGTYLAVTGSGGVAFEQIDEVDPDDDTSFLRFIVASSSATNRVLYFELSDPADAGLDDGDEILLVHTYVGVRVAAQASYEPRLKVGATSAAGSSTTVAVEPAWSNNDDTVPAWGRYVARTDPTTAAWTTSTLENTEIGIRAPDATPDVEVTIMVAQVVFTPGDEEEPSPGSGTFRTLTGAGR